MKILLLQLPDGVQLTLSELREMACRQQAQIESQHQLLAAKEQRLRYLKEQEARQQRVQAESERLKRLRDRVDAQELKLRKLRALRGQVDHQKQNNISLSKYRFLQYTITGNLPILNREWLTYKRTHPPTTNAHPKVLVPLIFFKDLC